MPSVGLVCTTQIAFLCGYLKYSWVTGWIFHDMFVNSCCILFSIKVTEKHQAVFKGLNQIVCHVCQPVSLICLHGCVAYHRSTLRLLWPREFGLFLCQISRIYDFCLSYNICLPLQLSKSVEISHCHSPTYFHKLNEGDRDFFFNHMSKA